MTRRKALPALLLFHLIAALGLSLPISATAQQEPFAPISASITLDAPRAIRTGAAWSLQVTVSGAAAGETIDLTALSGLTRYDTALQIGTGGVATWDNPAGVFTQAGDSLIVVRYGDIEARHALRVLPRAPTQADLVTSANTIPAYSDGLAMLVALPRDEWGNPPLANREFDLSGVAVFPDTSRKTLEFDSVGGLAWVWIRSHSEPGRIRIRLEDDLAALELVQSPGVPAAINLSLMPDCLLSDERDLVMLAADVTDIHGSLVADGTIVSFYWADGFGSALTIAGRASLRVPPPAEAGIREYSAHSGAAFSSDAALRVVEETCSNESDMVQP